jgi:hypothetical protein
MKEEPRRVCQQRDTCVTTLTKREKNLVEFIALRLSREPLSREPFSRTAFSRTCLANRCFANRCLANLS